MLEDLVSRVLQHLAGLAYMESTRVSVHRCCKRFLRFARERGGEDEGLTSLVDRYLVACRTAGDREYREPSGQRLARHATRLLTEFAVHGCFQLRGKIAKQVALAPALDAVLSDYRAFCASHMQHRRGTLVIRERDIRRFFLFLQAHDIGSAEAVDARLLSKFIATRTPKQSTVLSMELSSLRSLFRFLLMRGTVSAELVEQFAAFRVSRPQPLPAVWRRDDVKSLLAAVDRSSPVGKRDYAILLLAAQLGLRVGDIKTLRLDDISWDEAQIKLTQSKTGSPLRLPLSEELGAALIDYLQHGRPSFTAHRQIFLRAHAPFQPLGADSKFGDIISRYRRLAGVPLSPPPRWRGLHSLRHSLASRLIEAGTPVPVISSILGHATSESTETYIRIDVDSLRGVALDLAEEVQHAA